MIKPRSDTQIDPRSGGLVLIKTMSCNQQRRLLHIVAKTLAENTVIAGLPLRRKDGKKNAMGKKKNTIIRYNRDDYLQASSPAMGRAVELASTCRSPG